MLLLLLANCEEKSFPAKERERERESGWEGAHYANCFCKCTEFEEKAERLNGWDELGIEDVCRVWSAMEREKEGAMVWLLQALTLVVCVSCYKNTLIYPAGAWIY